MEITKDDSTILKAIGIIFVIVCHVGGAYTRCVTPLGGIGVSIFLFLSGYGLTKSFLKKGIKDYWKKRIIAVFIPYFIIETIVTIINLVLVD